jgi:hypothetical protein
MIEAETFMRTFREKNYVAMEIFKMNIAQKQ